MSIDIEFRRHSIKDGPNPQMVGPAGYRLARAIGERQLRGRSFTHFFVSSYWRTHQTLAAFAEGAGDFHLKFQPPSMPAYIVSDEVKAMWRECHKVELRGDDMVEAAFAYDGALARMIAADTAESCCDWMAGLDDGTRALVIGHSPSMELMLLGLSGERIPGLAECAGFRIIGTAGAVQVVHEERLDPTAIRRSLGL